MFLLMLIFISGCGNNGCKKITCGQNQECYYGSCFCNAGFYGENCDSVSYLKFIGNWQASGSCNSSGGAIFYPYISTGSSYGIVLVDNFLNQYQIQAQLNGTQDKRGNYFYIPEQQLGGLQGDYVQGEGNYDPTLRRMTLNVNLRVNGNSSACQMVWYKQ